MGVGIAEGINFIANLKHFQFLGVSQSVHDGGLGEHLPGLLRHICLLLRTHYHQVILLGKRLGVVGALAVAFVELSGRVPKLPSVSEGPALLDHRGQSLIKDQPHIRQHIEADHSHHSPAYFDLGGLILEEGSEEEVADHHKEDTALIEDVQPILRLLLERLLEH